jgi:hypothetical protein
MDLLIYYSVIIAIIRVGFSYIFLFRTNVHVTLHLVQKSLDNPAREGVGGESNSSPLLRQGDNNAFRGRAQNWNEARVRIQGDFDLGISGVSGPSKQMGSCFVISCPEDEERK